MKPMKPLNTQNIHRKTQNHTHLQKRIIAYICFPSLLPFVSASRLSLVTQHSLEEKHGYIWGGGGVSMHICALSMHIFAWPEDHAARIREITTKWPSTAPVDLGSMGYDGTISTYFPRSVLVESHFEDGAVLQHYRGWNASWSHNEKYFDSLASIDRSLLRPCNETRFMASTPNEDYLRVTGQGDPYNSCFEFGLVLSFHRYGTKLNRTEMQAIWPGCSGSRTETWWPSARTATGGYRRHAVAMPLDASRM